MTAEKQETIKAVIIDDEPGCIQNLQSHLRLYCPYVEVVATGQTITAAGSLLKKPGIDLAFLDIQLATDNSFGVLNNNTEHHPEIVFVTAYDSYAVRAFGVGAVDYILKPINKDELIRACERVRTKLRSGSVAAHDAKLAEENNEHHNQKIILFQGEHVYVVPVHDIYYLEGKRAYTTVCFSWQGATKKVTVSRPISRMERELPDPVFFRVHKSFLINLLHVKEYVRGEGGTVLMSNGMEIEVSRRKKELFLTKVKEYFKY